MPCHWCYSIQRKFLQEQWLFIVWVPAVLMLLWWMILERGCFFRSSTGTDYLACLFSQVLHCCSLLEGMPEGLGRPCVLKHCAVALTSLLCPRLAIAAAWMQSSWTICSPRYFTRDGFPLSTNTWRTIKTAWLEFLALQCGNSPPGMARVWLCHLLFSLPAFRFHQCSCAIHI